MLKKILIGVAAALALLVVVISLQPATFHVERSVTVSAPPEIVFAQVNDFHAAAEAAAQSPSVAATP